MNRTFNTTFPMGQRSEAQWVAQINEDKAEDDDLEDDDEYEQDNFKPAPEDVIEEKD